MLDGVDCFIWFKYMWGDNVLGLIYVVIYGDFVLIKSDIEVVVIMGNLMGWYFVLVCVGVVLFEVGFKIVNMMGSFM